jgi:hypothetical protein
MPRDLSAGIACRPGIYLKTTPSVELVYYVGEVAVQMHRLVDPGKSLDGGLSS